MDIQSSINIAFIKNMIDEAQANYLRDKYLYQKEVLSVNMDYTLMHKNVKVADLTIDSATAVISSIGDIYDIAHTPVGIAVSKGKIDRGELNKWWTGRAIPASRMGIKEALDTFGIDSTTKLLNKAYGLSLSDQFWIKPKNADLTWADVNFFENDFSDDVGDILFGEQRDSNAISLLSPDNTSDGWLKKKWKIIDGVRVLLKSGSGATQQEPYNEVIASTICKRLGINHIPYRLTLQNEYPFSVCDNFVTKDTEFVSAWSVYQTAKKQKHISVYRHFLDCAKNLGIYDMEDAINKMIVLDYLIGNEDRHFNNFGVIRNAETLEYLGAAPIFDSGTSLWFDKPIAMIGKGTKMPCKPFKSSHEEQIKLVTSFDFFELSALVGIEDEIREITKGSVFVEEHRVNAICKGLLSRIEHLADLILSHERVDELSKDVLENIAYSGEDIER